MRIIETLQSVTTLLGIIVALLLMLSCTILKYVNLSKEKTLKEFESDVYMLFLYAQKTDLVSSERMNFVIKEAYKIMPDNLKKNIKEENFEQYVQDLYKKFQDNMKDVIENNKKNENKKEK